MTNDLPTVLMPADAAIRGYNEVCTDLAEFLGILDVSLSQGGKLDPMELTALKMWKTKLKRANALYSKAKTVIAISQRDIRTVHASVSGRSQKWEAGRNTDEAIGKLVISHPDVFLTEVESA